MRRENDGTDTAAKSAHSLPITSMKLPARVTELRFEEMAGQHSCVDNKLRASYHTVQSRREVVITNRLRLGHSCFIHS